MKLLNAERQIYIARELIKQCRLLRVQRFKWSSALVAIEGPTMYSDMTVLILSVKYVYALVVATQARPEN